jgi:3-oxoacyl-[acyl-carrier protein] reductase
MNLDIAGKRAIVCASSRGLGRACAEALSAEGVHVVLNGRDPARLTVAAGEIEIATGTPVAPVAADVTTAEGREALLASCPEPDILITNNAGPPPGSFSSFERDDWMQALESNMLAPLLLIRAVLDGMRQRGFGRIVNITSAMVTTPRAHMSLSSGARAGLTAVVKGLSLEVARDGVTINNLLPERIDTERQAFMARRAMERDDISYEEARSRIAGSIAVGRLGRPEELGATCAFVCSVHAGFMSGMNIHIDGGSYPALV